MYRYLFKKIVFIFLTAVPVLTAIQAVCQTSKNEVPMIGAEVFIEPGQTPEEIDTWFRRLKEAAMTVTRIRMFESYMHKPDGSWDYSLFDLAFRAAEKYDIKEYKPIDDIFDLKLPDANLTLPAHLWKGTIRAVSAKPVGVFNNEIIASLNQYGKGEVIWIPSLVGLGSRIKKDYTQLSYLLRKEAALSLEDIPFRFVELQNGLLMKTMQSDKSIITIIINKSAEKRDVQLQGKGIKLKPRTLYADNGGSVSNATVQISPEETIVIEWR